MFTVFVEKISQEFDIEPDNLFLLEFPKDRNCPYRLTRGKNKGSICGSKAHNNGFCGKHQNSAVTMSRTFGGVNTKGKTKKDIQTEQKIAKTKQEIIDLLATAIPEKTTILKRTEIGLVNPSTDIVFELQDKEYTAIGVANGDNTKISNLTRLETEICEKMGWRYDYSKVEELEDESE